jgi:hypothetical protein
VAELEQELDAARRALRVTTADRSAPNLPAVRTVPGQSVTVWRRTTR